MKILITGASSGIGKDMAKVLAKKENEIIIIARDENKLNQTKKELEEKGAKVKSIVADLSNEENCKEIYKKVPDIDILINNAGFGDCGNFTKTSLEKELNMI